MNAIFKFLVYGILMISVLSLVWVYSSTQTGLGDWVSNFIDLAIFIVIGFIGYMLIKKLRG